MYEVVKMEDNEHTLPEPTEEFLKEYRINTKVRQDIVALGECNRCGFCCISTYPELSKDEIVRLTKYFKMESEKQFVDKYCTGNPVTGHVALKRPCPFFEKDDKGNDKGRSVCTIYKVRPRTCKEFPFANDSLEYGPCACGNNIILDLMKANALPGIFERWEICAKEYGIGVEKIADANFWQNSYYEWIKLYDEGRFEELKNLDPKSYPSISNTHLRFIVWKSEHLRFMLDVLKAVKKIKDDKEGILVSRKIFSNEKLIMGYKFSAKLPNTKYNFNFKIVGIDDEYVIIELCPM